MELCSMLCGSLDRCGAEGEWIRVYMWLSPFPVHLKLSQIVNQYRLWFLQWSCMDVRVGL